MESKVKIEKKFFIKQGKCFRDIYTVDKHHVIWKNEIGYLTRCQNKVTKIIMAVKILYKRMFLEFEDSYAELKKLKEFV